MAVGQSMLTLKGSYALADASSTGKSIRPKFYKVSNQDIPLDPTLTDLTGVWKQADISGYFPIDENTVEFLVDISPEEASSYGKTFGLYLEDGTLFMIAKPPYPFPPALRQTFKIQLVYNNVNNLVDFQYLPFYETEQDLAIFDVSMTFFERLQIIRQEIEDLKLAKDRLFANDKEQRAYEEALTKRIEKLEADVNDLQQNQIALAASFYSLALITQRNTEEIQRILNGLKI